MSNTLNNKQNQQSDKSTKAYSNMMLYLRELKLHNEKSSQMVERLYEESRNTNDNFSEIMEKQEKSDENRDNDVRILKREMSVLSSTVEENLTKRIDELEYQLSRTKRTLVIYMRILIWIMVMILFVNIINFLPITQFFNF